ncbi:protein translocase subunit SecF [Kineosporia sp. A_224]|uniref:protein translocase subunit SecF n=1 Tax=Kineosporia sp. A_224 TaxID=1962180 RepID=UPI000B4B7E20|nr:protein translocase subunit SecF [Kineosporia sp. A_224]
MPSFAQFGNDLYTGKRSIDFIERRRTWYLIAAVAVLISLGALGINRLNPGIEFRGGSEFTVSKVSTTDQGLARDAVRAIVPNNEPRISTVGDNSVRVQTDQLSDAETEEVQAALAKAYSVPETQVSSSFVGPSWGADVTNKALTGLAVFLVLVSLVIALYFRTWKMAAAGIVALLHDLLLTVGVYALVGFEVTPASVIGFLTILGYSLYDTVVVFDKVRENTEHVLASTKRTYAEAANLAVNQTLVRSINTSVVALLPVASILFIGAFVLGAGTLKDISLALFVGIAAGTYSSIFIATPLLVTLRSREPEIQQQAARVARRRAEQGDRPEEALVSVGAGEDVQEATAATATAASQTGRPAAPAQRQQPRKGTSRGGRPGNRKR